MKKIFFTIIVLLLCINNLHAQSDCTFKAPFLTIDFGSGMKPMLDINFFPLSRYRRDYTTCPNDGFYSYATNTSDCFNGDWLTFNEDHTPGDIDGRMMLVNASETGGIFFNFLIKNLKGNTTYQLAAWMINVCRINGGCSPLPPNILVKVRTVMGKELASFYTGVLSQNAIPVWKKYEGVFTTPADADMVLLTMEDVTLGGCGNDFAMDDITLQECVKTIPIVIKPKPEVKEPIATPVIKKEEKKQTPKPQPQKINTVAPAKKDTVVVTRRTVPDKIQNIPTSIKQQPVVTVPKPILTRENPVIKKIETTPGEMLISLYDNGEIDGDTVTVYDNNKLVVSRAGLSAKAVSFRVQVDAAHPHHEVVMVAENLGSIPPNTSLMVITINDKRYEIFISSSEQKNAKIVIELKE